MSNPSHNDRMELEIFDSFSKTVMRNTGRNIASASKTIETNETVSTDTVQYILKTHGEREIYPSEHIPDSAKLKTPQRVSKKSESSHYIFREQGGVYEREQ